MVCTNRLCVAPAKFPGLVSGTPVGRYKWDAWNRLGDMSRENAMAAYVDEMKKVAQEVIDSMPINEKTASFYHYFEPLYHVIHDMPRPPEALLSLRPEINANELATSFAEEGDSGVLQEETAQKQVQELELDLEPVSNSDPQIESADLAPSEVVVLTSDSESEIFCDSVEQLDNIKGQDYRPISQVTQMGAGQGGEGTGDGSGLPKRWRDPGREGMRHVRREPPGGIPYSGSRRVGQPALGAEGGGGGGGDGDGDDDDGNTDRLQDCTQVQQQIVLALRRLREDMQSVMERLEVVEGLAAANAQNSQWRSHMQFTAQQAEAERWWPFDVSGRTLLFLLVWPFIAQGMSTWPEGAKRQVRRLHGHRRYRPTEWLITTAKKDYFVDEERLIPPKAQEPMVASTRATGTAFWLMDTEDVQSEKCCGVARGEKTFAPMRFSSGRISIGTENNRCILGSVVWKRDSPLQANGGVNFKSREAGEKNEDSPHALFMRGGDKFTSSRPLRSRSEKEFPAGGNVLGPVRKSNKRWECTVMELVQSDAAPAADDRGRQRDDRQKSAVSEKQVQRSQLEVCPGLLSGDRGRERSDPEPRAGDAAGDDGLLAENASRGPQNKGQPGCPGAATTSSSSHGLPGKRKHRRRPSKKKRRWKPYFKLTWEEKKELDERETARASRVRAEMFAKGLPVAPYNTTQFLMEEHDREEPDLNTELCGRFEDTASEEEHFEAADEEDEAALEEEEGEGSDGMGRPGHAGVGGGGGAGGGAGGGGEFLQRDFSETYERYHVETLQNMSKQELVREYLELEKCLSRLEEENNRLERRARRSAGDCGGGGMESALQRVRQLEGEVERLRALNGELLLNQQRGLNGSRAAEPEPERENQ
ncbi:hypothetical protein AOLI_G00130750 [Acnodon oligacanthus]